MLRKLATLTTRRFSFIFLLSFALLTTFSTLTFAIAPMELQNLDTAKEASDEFSSLEDHTDNTVGTLQAVLVRELGGTLAGAKVGRDGQPLANGGIIGRLALVTGEMYRQQPANTTTYVADLLQSANIAPPAYAQGLGFAALSPVLNTWKTFRNLAYLFFVIVFVSIGFMIMFRQKVGQTAVTAQQAIPQIIVALLTVTFSYAIAGLLIDAMYLVMFFLVGVFGEKTTLIDKNIIQLTMYVLTHGTLSSVDAVGDFISGSLSGFGGAIATGGELIGEITFLLIILIAITVAMFKLFFELIKTYISIIISIALAPLILMLGAIPGQNTFRKWLKSLIGNLAAFPTVLMVLIFYSELIETRTGTDGSGFMPPYLFGQSSGDALVVLVGIGLVFALPEVVKKVKDTLGGGEGPMADLLKAGWSRAWDQRGKATGLMAAPFLGAGGAAAGYYLGNKFADTTGLEGGRRTAATALGGIVGATVGMRAPQIARGLVGTTVKQTRDAIIRMQVEKGATSLDTAQGQRQTSADRNIAERNKARGASVREDILPAGGRGSLDDRREERLT